jgi:hypothetical protein
MTTTGRASGDLVGGNLEMLARSVGVVDVSWRGCIVMVEANKASGWAWWTGPDPVALSGAFDHITGVALGSFDQFAGYRDRGWTVVDTLRDLLDDWACPSSAGFPWGTSTTRSPYRWGSPPSSTLTPAGSPPKRSFDSRPPCGTSAQPTTVCGLTPRARSLGQCPGLVYRPGPAPASQGVQRHEALHPCSFRLQASETMTSSQLLLLITA